METRASVSEKQHCGFSRAVRMPCVQGARGSWNWAFSGDFWGLARLGGCAVRVFTGVGKVFQAFWGAILRVERLNCLSV